MKNYTTKELNDKVKPYIIDCIDCEGYNFPKDRKVDDCMINTTEGKLEFLMDTFKSEYGWCIERLGIYKAFQEWLMGLPSCFNIEFRNYDILQLAKEWNSIPQDATERQEGKILENWWNFITVKTFQLFSKYKIN